MSPFVRDPDEMPDFLPSRMSALGPRKLAGIADFQRIVAQGISQQLLTWKGIEATEKLAASPNSKVVVIGSGSSGLPIILGNQ